MKLRDFADLCFNFNENDVFCIFKIKNNDNTEYCVKYFKSDKEFYNDTKVKEFLDLNLLKFYIDDCGRYNVELEAG